MNESLKFFQQFLINQGVEAGPADGKMSAAWSDAIEQWQRQNDLVGTGYLDFATTTYVANSLQRLTGERPGGMKKKAYDEAVKRYGSGLMAYINHDELGPIIIAAAKEGRDKQWLLGQLQQTQYWKDTGVSLRQWNEQKMTDPATAQQRLDAARNTVRDTARMLGLTLEDWKLEKIADNAVGFQWIDGGANAMLRDVLLKTVRPAAQRGRIGEPIGEIGSVMAQLKQRAADYLVPLGNKDAQKYALNILRDEQTLDGMDSLWRQLGKARFPHLGEIIDNGVSLRDYFRPLQEDVARLLDRQADDIDLNAPKWAKLTNIFDEKAKVHRAMTRDEAMQLARQQTEYLTSRDANDRYAALGTQLVNTFGKGRIG